MDGGVRFLPAWRIFVNKEGGVESFLDFTDGMVGVGVGVERPCTKERLAVIYLG